MKQRFELIIFDWDGTLIDSIEWIVHCLQHAARQCGLPASSEQAARDVIGLSIHEAMRALFPKVASDTHTALVDAYETLFASRQPGPEDLFDGVPALLDELDSAGYQLAVATGKSRRGLDAVLATTQTAHHFAATRCADETASKPHPRMLLEILDELNVPAERALMVGDSVHDMQMARHASMPAIAVATGTHPPDLLQRFEPLHCLSAITDLPLVLA